MHVTPADRLPEENFTAFRHAVDRTLDRLAAAHVRTIVVTHATRFGPQGTHPDAQLDAERRLLDDILEPWRAKYPQVRVEARTSGGVSSLDDLRVLRELVDIGVEGAIVGKALYAGAFTLEQALEVASG